MTTHTFGSLFAGVGGFDLGMEAAGWSCSWQVEWDKQCQQVLKHHWPDVERHGDVSDVNGSQVRPVDCITFGSPCQDLSVAGKRAGLDGDRSGLFYEAIRIIREMRDATGSVQPRWAVWGNVVGALSSNRGHDFAAVIDSLAEAGALVIEWAVLDAQHFGVPQRRRRVFVVACFDPATADRCGDPLLPVAESLPRHLATSRTKRQATARSVAYGIGTDSGVAGPLGSNRNGGHRIDLDNAGAYVATFSKSKRAQSVDDDETWVEGAVAPTLNQFDQGDTRATVLAIAENQRNEVTLSCTMGSLSSAGGGKPGGQGYPAVLFEPRSALEENWSAADVKASLRAEASKSSHAVLNAAAVRRLTPIECERLMGWPDDHTRWGVDDSGNVKEMPDSPRYRMIGNGVASPVAAWIGKHLRAVDGDL